MLRKIKKYISWLIKSLLDCNIFRAYNMSSLLLVLLWIQTALLVHMYGMIIKLEINYDTHYIPNCEKSRKSVDVTAYLQEFIYKTSLFLNDERKENREIGK